MKERLLLALLSVALLQQTAFGQSFVNGDMEGQSLPYDTPVIDWEYLDYNDINCLATDAGEVTSDVITVNGPIPSAGMIGAPFSGQSFVAGSFTEGANYFYQEGIQQTVSGFNIGQEYVVSFYQANVKTAGDLDTSGNWMVIVDDSIIGITDPTISHEAFDHVNLNWERRQVQFIATRVSHTIKFLPFDDDTVHTLWETGSNGSLYMGIDSVSLYSTNPSGVSTSNSTDFTIFPNPTESDFRIDGYLISKILRVRVYNSMGALVSDKQLLNRATTVFNLPESTGLYHIEIMLADGTTTYLKVVKE